MLFSNHYKVNFLYSQSDEPVSITKGWKVIADADGLEVGEVVNKIADYYQLIIPTSLYKPLGEKRERSCYMRGFELVDYLKGGIQEKIT